ncbi:hypothetical protein CVU75_02225 [Candidatus Dependentiae bacterium HGW-Dependentiae-1]|nr:MAG: hypothetical protein CVU75_02225 [Candidatus Dependentiae bacterium HGW-Dependentiae-1]
MALEKERLQKKYKKAIDALATLQEALVDLNESQTLAQCAQRDPERLYKTFRDSLVQRFEYTFDTTWKYLGEYLPAQGRILEIKTPKAIFRECLKAKLLSEKEVIQAIKMVDHRNLTAHGYDELLVEEISGSIPVYAVLLGALLLRAKITE